MCIPHVNIHVENEGRDLLNHTGDGEISTKLLCVLHVAAATGLQVTGVRRSIDRRDVEDDKLTGSRQCLAQLFGNVLQPPLFVRLRSIHFALQAGIEKFEVEHSDFERIGMCQRRDQQHQRDDETRNSHDRGP